MDWLKKKERINLFQNWPISGTVRIMDDQTHWGEILRRAILFGYSNDYPMKLVNLKHDKK